MSLLLLFQPQTSTRFQKILTASLSLSGGLTKQASRPFAATLGFAGTMGKVMGKTLSAHLSFTGAIGRAISHQFASALGFVGNMTKQIPRSFTAALDFTGAFTAMKIMYASFTAALSFTGGMGKQIGKGLVSQLGFATNIQKFTTRALSAQLNLTVRFLHYAYPIAFAFLSTVIGSKPTDATQSANTTNALDTSATINDISTSDTQENLSEE